MVCWVHELDGVADRVLPAQRASLLARVDHFVAAGDWTARMLADRFGIARPLVTAVDEPIAEVPPRPVAASDAPAPVDVLGVGSLAARKGADAFVAVVALLAATRPHLRAAWIGAGDPAQRALVTADIAAAGLGGRLHLVGDRADLEPWWPHQGLLLHTAREDPFPLVAAEAGARGVPVVTWATGGAADLLARSGSAHLVAPAGDVIGLAQRAGALLDDPAARARAGAALRTEAAHLTTDHQAPVVWAACVGGPP
ncbi:glycosyltransferase family 4 protein [Aquihabitans sp. G128]|uniref:glycosyltransferase family 4 protein n=1 Tax=Aquihabitans sp. G128 TaxID=2849779 RepID=UPI001C24333B|nr:glycosyltransferase family 4 protein [Aquihabitans sp. G128]QXC60260.1 glycosyltransferase family 4 protein [Aquihabitans sp. G128]